MAKSDIYTSRGTRKVDSTTRANVGIFDFRDKDVVEGHITTPGQEPTTERVSGTYTKPGDLVHLMLIGESSGIRYSLMKGDGRKTIDGYYEGFWSVNGEVIDSRRTSPKMLKKDRLVTMTLANAF